MIKQGTGSTNDGNTSRKFFENYQEVSKITGFDEELLKRLYVVLQTLYCGKEIDVESFRKYSFETAKLFVEKYPWYYMPASVHKILMHGADIKEKI